MNSIISVLILICATSQAISFMDLILEEWDLFKVQHKKKYETNTEEIFRMKIFMDNRHKIANHNAKFERGEVHFKVGLNKYADMLHHEFVGTLNGFNRTRKARLFGANQYEEVPKPSFVGATFITPANVKFPDNVDWWEQGAVTPVKDQGNCGSCWSFSATGSLEGQNFRKTGELVSLSEQNLIDCTTGNDGCGGGFMDVAFQYVSDNQGIDTEESYIYEAMDDTCRYDPKDKGATDVGFVDIPSGDEQALMAAVATIGPVSVAIDSSQDSFQFYNEGVYDEPNCQNEPDKLDHAVLVVGYGTDEDSGKDFWLVKNSWGTSWGDNGYIKMARNADNQCGIATEASYPLV